MTERQKGHLAKMDYGVRAGYRTSIREYVLGIFLFDLILYAACGLPFLILWLIGFFT